MRTQQQKDCLHAVSKINDTKSGPYVCIKCAAVQKILNGILVSDARAEEIKRKWDSK